MEQVTHEAKLPSGRTITMREISGEQELSAAIEAGDDTGTPRGRAAFNLGCILRSIVAIDGQALDPVTTGEALRTKFRSKDWRCIQMMFDEIHFPSGDEVSSFRSSVRIGG